MKLRLATLALLAAIAAGGVWLARRTVRAHDENRSVERPTETISAKLRRGEETDGSAGGFSHFEDLSEPMRLILDNKAEYQERLVVIRELTAKLSPFDQEALQTFLLRRSSDEDSPAGAAIVNAIMDALCAMTPRPAWLEQTLAEVYRDGDRNEVIRDYAIQHLVAVAEAVPLNPAADPSRDRLMPQVFWEALGEIDNSIAGTALLGLARLSEKQPANYDRDRVSKEALRLAEARSASELTRIAAFQVCGRLGLKEVLPLALDAAERGETVALKASAVNVLGGLGGSEAKSFLTNLVNGAEERLRLPAQRALSEIQQQEQQNRASSRKT